MTYNRLKNEKSPYLLQHAQNPVDWYPWGEEAFEKARLEDKPIFLSIGYSTCHWCHVMEHESFENNEVAMLLNDVFVNIKVDREERPDIDAIYMKVCHLMTQSGGWPLTIMMTPDKKPFFAGTYIPREMKYGRLGMLEMIPQVKNIWQTKRADVLSAASEITTELQRPATSKTQEIGEETLHRAYRSFSKSFDKTFGGFGQAPKFPSPHNFFFLLRYWKRTGEPQALRMVEHTLQNMRRGGIYDHIGFGFHRYSTDPKWIVPHFEKMLYDQALMVIAYIELFQTTGNKEYEQPAREILSYVLRDMTDGEGGFYCAEDADSEGVEGKFYLWTEKEIRSVLNNDEADLFLSQYLHADDATVQGMQEIPAGHFIPHLKPLSSGHSSNSLAEISAKMEGICTKLFLVREKRIHPHKDDKILTDWNGLMIAALARGAQVFDEQAYAQAAIRAMDFVLTRMTRTDGRLWHRYREGVAAIDAHIDDYAFVIGALLELYETTFETRYLERAIAFDDQLVKHFWDKKDSAFYFTADDAEALLARPKEMYDGAVPSGNSLALVNTLRLARITGDAEMERRAQEIIQAFSVQANAMPTAFTQFLSALDFAIGPASEVVIAGIMKNSDTQSMLKALRKSFVPNKVVIFRPDSSEQPEIEKIATFVKSHTSIGGKSMAYVCSNYSCQLPTNNPDEMMAVLDAKKAGDKD